MLAANTLMWYFPLNYDCLWGFLLYHADDAIKKQQILIYILGITLFGDFIRPSLGLRFFSQHFIAYGRWRDCNLAARWNIWMREIKRIGKRWEQKAQRKGENCRNGWNKREWWKMRGGEARQQSTKRWTSEGISRADAVKLESICFNMTLYSPPCWSLSLTPDLSLCYFLLAIITSSLIITYICIIFLICHHCSMYTGRII